MHSCSYDTDVVDTTFPAEATETRSRGGVDSVPRPSPRKDYTIRVTTAFLQVITYVRLHSRGIWGLQVCKATGLPSGTVYPILSRLEEYGWIEGVWDGAETKGPRRRLYEETAVGRRAMQELIVSRAGALPAASPVRTATT